MPVGSYNDYRRLCPTVGIIRVANFVALVALVAHFSCPKSLNSLQRDETLLSNPVRLDFDLPIRMVQGRCESRRSNRGQPNLGIEFNGLECFLQG